MKPFVIYLDNKDKISLSKGEFENYLKQAYEHGYQDGYNNGKSYSMPWYVNAPFTTNNPITNPSVTWTTTSATTEGKK